jgi:hypothetical protein
MDKRRVDIRDSKCYFCGRNQANLDEFQQSINKSYQNTTNSLNKKLLELEKQHTHKISEALKILKSIKKKFQHSTIKTDPDAFIGFGIADDEGHFDFDNYTSTPAINLIRELLLSEGNPVDCVRRNGWQIITDDDWKIRYRQPFSDKIMVAEYWDENEKKLLEKLQRIWDFLDLKWKKAEQWDIVVQTDGEYREWKKFFPNLREDDIHHISQSEDIKFGNLLPFYIEFVPLYFKRLFHERSDYGGIERSLIIDSEDESVVPVIKLHDKYPFGAPIGTRHLEKIPLELVVSECTICKLVRSYET